MPTQLAPIDESVKIPEAVKRAAAFAEAHYAPAAPADVPAQVHDQGTQPPPAAPTNPDQPINMVVVPTPTPVETPRPLLAPGQENVPAQVQPAPAPQPGRSPITGSTAITP